MIRAADEIRLLRPSGASRGCLPLVVAVGWQQAAPPGEGGSERRFLADSLRPRVDHPAANGDVLSPGWHQPPADYPQLACGPVLRSPLTAWLPRQHGVYRLGGSHVVVRRQRLRDPITLHAELLKEFDARARRRIPATHRLTFATSRETGAASRLSRGVCTDTVASDWPETGGCRARPRGLDNDCRCAR